MIYQHPTNLFFHQLLKITPQSFLNFYKYHSNSTFFFGDLLLLNHLSPEQQSMTTSNILRAINLFVKLNQIELGVNLMKSFLRKSQKFQNENEFTTFLDLFVKLNEKLDEDAQRPLMKQIRKNKELWELSINRFDETYLKFFRKIPKAIQRDLMDNFQTNNIFWRLITSDLQSLLTIIYENHHELQERHWRTIKESFSDMSEEFLKNEQELLEMLKEFVKFSFSQIYRSNGISIEVLREILERIHPNWKTFNFVELSITIQSLIWHVPLLEENEYIFMKNVSIEKYINIMNYKLKYHNYINVNSAFVSMFLRDIQNRIMRDIEFQSIISTKKKSGKKLIADEKGEIEKNFNLKTIQIEMVKLIYLLYEKNGFEECSHDNELKDDSSKKRKVINDDETNTSDGNDWINLREFYLPSLKENVKYKSINTFDKYYEPFFRIIYTGTTNQPDLYLYELLRKFEKRISIEENEQIFYLWDKTARNYFQYQIDVRLNSKMEREKFERILMDGKIYLNKRIDIDYSYEQQIFSASELFGQFKKKFLLESAIQFESVKFEKTIQSFDNKQNFIIYDPRFVLPIFSRLLNGDLSIDPLKILVGNQILTYLISMSQCRITRIRMCSLYNLNICDIYHMRTGKFEFKNDVYFLMDMFRFGATFNHYQIVRNKKNKMIPLDRKQFPAKLFWIDKWLILAIGHFFRIIASYSSDTDEQPTNVHQILNRCFVNQSTTMISSFGLFSQFIHSLPSLNSNEDGVSDFDGEIINQYLNSAKLQSHQTSSKHDNNQHQNDEASDV
ncbi:hypothetical protein SNEBB_002662 [Seison nebaliae]|nr:hypothetical protein SNEBB_002662 [Seison nebaliae]